MSDIIASLDIGTGNIRVIIAEISETGNLQIIGFGSAPSTGLKKGIVVNIENTVQGINCALEAAEMMSGMEISLCHSGIGGSHIEGINSKGVYPISDKGGGSREIDYDDITSVINSAKAVVIPLDRKIIRVIPQTYTVDQQTDIKDPYNMIGVRLEAEAHIITGSVTAIQNIVRCIERANIGVSKMMYNGLAAVKAVMTKEEQELGSLLIDIGAGVTDVVVMHGGAPLFTSVIPAGGDLVTKDLAVIKKISFESAEEIKISDGCCWHELLEGGEEIILPGMGGRSPIIISRTDMCDILQMRMAEIFYIIKNKIESLIKNKPLNGNIILCGGGAMLSGCVELASYIFETASVRVGFPGVIGGISGEYRRPDFASSIGLILEASENIEMNGNKSGLSKSDIDIMGKIKNKVKNIFKNLF